MKKKKGSISYFFMPFVFLLCLVLIIVTIYMRSVDTLADNYKASIDAANLSVTTFSLNDLLTNNILSISGKTYSDNTLHQDEKTAVEDKFVEWEDALQKNMGLTDDFNFSGGTCGWAGHNIASGAAKVDYWVLYDFALSGIDSSGNYIYTVWKYSIKDIDKKTLEPTITKTAVKDDYGNLAVVVKTPLGNDLSSNANIDGLHITGPTLKSKVSFPVKAPFGLGKYRNKEEDTDNVSTFLNGNMVVSKTSTTSIENR